MEISLLIAFIGSSVLLTIMPGPDNIFVLTQSVTRGAKTGVLISIGLVSGIIVHTALAATGLSIIIQQSAYVYQIILYAGAFYLFFLAYQATKEKAVSVDELNNSEVSASWQKLIRTGFFMNVLNPKVTLFFVAFLPQFISQEGWSIPLQFSVLGLSFLIQALVIFSMISVVSGQLSHYINSPNFWTMAKWVKVTILAGLAVFLLL